MNLVAKEYIAAQDPEDPGVLILSRFAGAAMECKPALLVNPYDSGSGRRCNPSRLVDAVRRTACRDYEALYKIIAANDIQDWPGRFLKALTGSSTLAPSITEPDEPPLKPLTMTTRRLVSSIQKFASYSCRESPSGRISDFGH